MSMDSEAFDVVFEAFCREGPYAKTFDKAALFERFVVEQVLKPYLVTSEDVESGIVDGKCDGGIDGIYTLVDECPVVDIDSPRIANCRNNVPVELFLFQATTKPGFALRRLDAAISFVKEALSSSPSLDAFSDAVREQIEMFHRVVRQLATKNRRVRVRYVGASLAESGDIDKARAARLSTLATEISETMRIPVDSVNTEILGRRELYRLNSTVVPAKLVISSRAKELHKPTGGLILLVSLWDYYSAIVREDGRLRHELFDSNVRDYLGPRTSVNKKIYEELKNGRAPQRDFWWLNNGVTIVCDEHQRTGDYVLNGAQIVNGLQTTESIYDYISEMANGGYLEEVKTDEREVLLKVLPIKDEEIRDDVIHATNHQTPLTSDAFFASSAFHRTLESALAKHKIYYERRRNLHRRQNREFSRIITPTQMSQALQACVLRRPDIARARPRDCFRSELEHNQVFDPDLSPEVYARAAALLLRINASIAASRDASVSRAFLRNVKFHGLTVLWPEATTMAAIEGMKYENVIGVLERIHHGASRVAVREEKSIDRVLKSEALKGFVSRLTKNRKRNAGRGSGRRIPGAEG